MENLLKLKNELPHGYSKILKQRMKKKHKKELSTASIRKGLMQAHLNDLILEEAILLVEELREKKEKLNKNLQNL